MKKFFLGLLAISLTATACNAPTSTSPADAAPAQPVEFTAVPTFTPPLPTDTLAPVPTLTPPPTVSPQQALPSANQIEPIRFAANGTYADVVGNVSIGAKKVFSVDALKGQIMSVSILPQSATGDWTVTPMYITTQDGSYLCGNGAEQVCYFWRGALPATQTYYITIFTQTDLSQFTLRVAINPPGVGEQYFKYVNPQTGASIVYSDSFAPALPVYASYKSKPAFTLQFIDTPYYTKTNLGEAYLFFGFHKDPQIVATCADPNPNGAGEFVEGSQGIGGISFTHSTTDGAGAGNYYHEEIYRGAKNNICYEIIAFFHSSNVGNFPPEFGIQEFNRDAIMQKMKNVISTLVTN